MPPLPWGARARARPGGAARDERRARAAPPNTPVAAALQTINASLYRTTLRTFLVTQPLTLLTALALAPRHCSACTAVDGGGSSSHARRLAGVLRMAAAWGGPLGSLTLGGRGGAGAPDAWSAQAACEVLHLAMALMLVIVLPALCAHGAEARQRHEHALQLQFVEGHHHQHQQREWQRWAGAPPRSGSSGSSSGGSDHEDDDARLLLLLSPARRSLLGLAGELLLAACVATHLGELLAVQLPRLLRA